MAKAIPPPSSVSTPPGGGEGGGALPWGGTGWALHRVRESKRQIFLDLPIAMVLHLLNAIVKARIEEHLSRDISAESE